MGQEGKNNSPDLCPPLNWRHRKKGRRKSENLAWEEVFHSNPFSAPSLFEMS